MNGKDSADCSYSADTAKCEQLAALKFAMNLPKRVTFAARSANIAMRSSKITR